MKEKELYEAPLVECYEIKLESKILVVSGTKNTIKDAEIDEWEEML